MIARDQADLATACALTVSARITRHQRGAVEVSRRLPRPERVAATGLSPAPARLRVRGREKRKAPKATQADHEGAADGHSRHKAHKAGRVATRPYRTDRLTTSRHRTPHSPRANPRIYVMSPHLLNNEPND